MSRSIWIAIVILATTLSPFATAWGKDRVRKRDQVRDQPCLKQSATATSTQTQAGQKLRKRDQSCLTKTVAPAAAPQATRQRDRIRLCEDCGCPLMPGDPFCELCGAACVGPDDDGDGIPNGRDEDYVRPRDGTGARHRAGR